MATIMLSFGAPVPTPVLTTAWVAGVQIAMVLPEITMITAMRSAATVSMSIGVPIAGRWTSLESLLLLLARRFPNGAKDATLVIDPNLLGGRLLDLLDLLDLLNLLDLPLAPFESRLAGDIPDSLRFRLFRTLDAHRALLTLKPLVRRSFGTLGALFGALGATLGPGVAFPVTILCEGSRWDHRPGHQNRNQNPTHRLLHQIRSDLVSR